MRLVFMGTPEFAVPSLAALVAAGHDIACVYTQPPRPAGRGQRAQASPVQQYAESHGFDLHFPTTLKDPREHVHFATLRPQAAVVAAYGLILPGSLLAVPPLGCLNVHASLLPRWRGAAPIQHCILAGDKRSGVAIMKMDAGLDTGPIVLAGAVRVTRASTAASLHDRLAKLGAELIVEALAGLADGTLTPTPQPEFGVSYAPRLARRDGRLDWRQQAAALERQVRAFYPWPGAWFETDGIRIKVLRAAVVRRRSRALPGTVLDDTLTVACGEGALRISQVQREGRDAMQAGDFLRGFDLPAGTVLPALDYPRR